jgi:DNA (cytosine-5)-methyltransferase 1
MTVTVGSLCTGIGGLDHGLTLAGLDTQTVFVSDIDKGACAWLEANVSAPNLGDFTAFDELPPVDILTAGFPCQPLSTAGLRKGVEDDRWLWDDIQRLVGRMESRPLVFLENVPVSSRRWSAPSTQPMVGRCLAPRQPTLGRIHHDKSRQESNWRTKWPNWSRCRRREHQTRTAQASTGTADWTCEQQQLCCRHQQQPTAVRGHATTSTSTPANTRLCEK